MGRWRSFLDSLDTNGGHIFLLFVLICVGFIVFVYDATAGGTIVTGSFGALLMMLKSSGTNREQLGATSTTMTVAQTTPAPSPGEKS